MDKHDVWSDFVHLYAIAMSNAVNFRQEREDLFMKIKSKYTPCELDKFKTLFEITIKALAMSPGQDFLGRQLMTLNLGSTRRGEYYTCHSVADLLSRLSAKQHVKDMELCFTENGKWYFVVNDPTCGTGALLLAYAQLCKISGRKNFEVLFVGQELSFNSALACYIQMNLLGLAGYVVVRDTLSEPLTNDALYAPSDAFCTLAYYTDIWVERRKWWYISRLLNQSLGSTKNQNDK